jgi:hypothetical protein
MTVSISLRCKCGKDFSVPNEADGMKVRCPACSEIVQVPSVVEELAQAAQTDKSTWIHVRCKCGYIVMGPRSWAGREGRCPRCHQRITLTTAAELAVPKPGQEFLLDEEESEADAPIKRQYKKLPGGRATTPIAAMSDSELQAELEKEIDELNRRKKARRIEQARREAEAARQKAEPLKKNAVKPPVAFKGLRKALSRANRGLKSLGIATLLTATLSVWLPRETIASAYLWIEKTSDRLMYRNQPPVGEVTAPQKHAGAGSEANGEAPRDPEEREKFLVACILGDMPSVTGLVEGGASLRERDKLGATPLHWAAGSGQLDVVRYLVEHGADSRAVDNQGNTPLRKAEIFGHKQVVEYLESVEAKKK